MLGKRKGPNQAPEPHRGEAVASSRFKWLRNRDGIAALRPRSGGCQARRREAAVPTRAAPNRAIVAGSGASVAGGVGALAAVVPSNGVKTVGLPVPSLYSSGIGMKEASTNLYEETCE